MRWQGQPVEEGTIVLKALDAYTHSEGTKIAQGKFSLRAEPGPW